MGRLSRQRKRRAVSLEGLRVVVDVQHLYRPNKPRDRGSVYTLIDGTTTTEGSAVVVYAGALRHFLEERGATVLTNDPTHGILIGPYSTRHRAVNTWKPHAYLACHLNAGGGGYALMEHMSMSRGKALAEAIGQALSAVFPPLADHRTQALKSTDRGAVCIERVAEPAAAVLCEPFFGDTPAHQSLLAAPELARVGRAIGLGLVEWWNHEHPAV